MITKNFNKHITLTSQTRESILSFDSTSESVYVVPWYDPSASSVQSLFVNGVNLSLEQSTPERLAVAVSPSIPAVFHIFTKSPYDFSLNLSFKRYSDASLINHVETVDVSVMNRPSLLRFEEFNMFENAKTLTENESSYLVLRSNPKLSGNVKIVVDSSDNLFIDTFKISDTLSNKRFRKQQVSANGIFSSDIRRVFQDIPSGDMYKTDFGNVLDITLPKTELDKQYNTTYSYGARLFQDELYPEDYCMLAPLWINSKLPDFFAVFKVDGPFNKETYAGDDISSISQKYMSCSKMVKSWSILPEDNLGKYLRNHLREMGNVQSPVFLPLSEYDHNVWNGISIKKGLICSTQETSYQFEKSADNFTDINAFISLGFERHNILCPNLINLEFAFNDDEAKMYSMNRYFGLYMSENVMYKIAYNKQNKNSTTFNIIFEGDTDPADFIKRSDDQSSVFNLDGSINDKYSNRIFVINKDRELRRVSNAAQLDSIEEVNEHCNETADNIFSSKAVKRNLNQFITVDILEKLGQGEHIRIIDEESSVMWEVYSIDKFIEEGECYPYCSKSVSASNYTIYRTTFSSKGSAEDQAVSLRTAFDMFSKFDASVPFAVTVTSGSSFSLVSNKSDGSKLRLQRLTNTANAQDRPYGNERSISFFGSGIREFEYSTLKFDASLGPIDFEYHGDRRSLIVDFIEHDGIVYSISPQVKDKFQPHMYVRNKEGWNVLVGSFDSVINGKSYSFQQVKDPLEIDNAIMIACSSEVEMMGDILNVYSPKWINLSVMGINSVKDFDFSVYDSNYLNNAKSEYSSSRARDKETYERIIQKGNTDYILGRNSYVIKEGRGDITIGSNMMQYTAPFGFNTFDCSAMIYARSNTAVTYDVLDGSCLFESLSPSYSEENIRDYYISDSLLKYPLTTPYVSKWVMQGMDCRNNEMRLALFSQDSSAFTGKVNSNFIPTLDSSTFSNEISFPSFKYLSLGGESWKDYVCIDMNDVVQSDASARLTLRDAMINNPRLDVFSKIMMSSSGTNMIKNRTSILSYNKYKNSVDTVYSGLKISLVKNNNLMELANIEKYNRFKFGFISTASRNYNNNKPIEVYINENIGTVLMVWYQGNDVLNYYYRNSSRLPGKGIMKDVADQYCFNYFYGPNDPSIHSFAKSQFFLKTDTLGISSKSVNSTRNSFPSEQSSPLIQMSHNVLYDVGSVFNAYTRDNSVNDNAYDPYVDVYQNFSGKFQYEYISNAVTYGNNIVNHCNIYKTNENYHSAETCDVKLLNKLFNENQIHFYIIRNDRVYDNNVFGSDAFSVQINQPKQFKGKALTHNGAYFPKFSNILNFSANEDETIIKLSKKDFISCNTNLISHDNIRQMWYNRVVQDISEKNISEKNAIGLKEGFNVFSSSWDRSYYTVYNVDEQEGLRDGEKNGYESAVEIPSFFGSKLPRLPRELKLSDWNDLNSSYSFDGNVISLRFNLSLSIQKLFKNEPTFVGNWANLPSGSKFIDQYIRSTVQNHYDINVNNIELELSASGGGAGGISNSSSGMTKLTSMNFHSELIYENQEYFYVINIKSSNNAIYHAIITVRQK